MGIRNIEVLYPWDEVEPFPDPIPPTPNPDPDPEPKFVVNTPNSSGIFTMSGTDAVVSMFDDISFRVNTPFVVDNGNGSYTATSE